VPRWLRSAAAFSWRLLVHDRVRLLASVGGVTFALLLMLLQLGFRNALLDSSLELLAHMNADVVVHHREKEPFLKRQRMPVQRLYQALAVEGVEAAYPVWLDLMYWKNFRDGTERPIRVVAFRPRDPVFDLPGVERHAEALRRRGTALIDARARDSYGFDGPGPAQLQRRPIEVIGTFRLGTDFEADGNLVLGEDSYFELTDRPRSRIELALLRLALDADPEEVVATLRAQLPGDVTASTRAELLARDKAYWERRTPISVILLIGVALGFTVGVVICYQILYTEVLDHLPEFATLKAMGYGNRYIRAVVITEAWLLAFVGYLPAVVLGAGMLSVLGQLTGLPARFTAEALLSVLGLSLGMCTLAGMLAVRRVTLADPAELF